MKVTAQEEYGLRCILQLARNHGGEPLVGRVIAEQEGLSVDYVTKLLMSLRRADLVQSVRGMKGGFILTRKPEEITVGHVLQALGEIVQSNQSQLCEHFPGQLSACIHLDACGIRPIWMILAQYISRVLDQITLADLLQDEVQVMGVFEALTHEAVLTAPSSEPPCCIAVQS